MDEEPSHPATPPDEQRRDAAARAGDLERMAGANADATYGDEEPGRAIVPGVISGDVGPKGRVSAQLRGLSRRERSAYGEVPRGTVAPGGGRYLLVAMVVFALVLLSAAALIGWVASR